MGGGGGGGMGPMVRRAYDMMGQQQQGGQGGGQWGAGTGYGDAYNRQSNRPAQTVPMQYSQPGYGGYNQMATDLQFGYVGGYNPYGGGYMGGMYDPAMTQTGRFNPSGAAPAGRGGMGRVMGGYSGTGYGQLGGGPRFGQPPMGGYGGFNANQPGTMYQGASGQNYFGGGFRPFGGAAGMGMFGGRMPGYPPQSSYAPMRAMPPMPPQQQQSFEMLAQQGPEKQYAMQPGELYDQAMTGGSPNPFLSFPGVGQGQPPQMRSAVFPPQIQQILQY